MSFIYIAKMRNDDFFTEDPLHKSEKNLHSS